METIDLKNTLKTALIGFCVGLLVTGSIVVITNLTSGSAPAISK